MRILLWTMVLIVSGFLSSAAAAQAPELPHSEVVRDYDDWVVQQSSLFVSAQTYNDRSMFGIFCGTTCSYFTNPGIPCEAGSTGAGMITSSNGAVAINVRCLHVKEDGEEQVFLLIDEDLSAVLDGAQRVTLNIATADDEMQVDRFSMKGAAAAQAKMRALVAARSPSASST